MAKKKKVLKKVIKKKSVKRVSSRPKKLATSRKSIPMQNKPIMGSRISESQRKKKIRIVVKNLILFVILFIVSLLLYNVSTNELFINLFWILALLTGFTSVAFLIVWLIFVFLKK